MRSLQNAYVQHETARRRVNTLSSEALNVSKRAIFSLHRADQKTAQAQLKEAEERLRAAEGIMKKNPSLQYEGVYLSALEEHAEAHLFLSYLKRGNRVQPPARCQRADVLIGGLSDYTGELVRYAVKQATAHDHKAVARAHAEVEAVVGMLLQLDLTGNLRQKFDQAKRNLRQMEQIAYELSIRS